MLEQSGSRTPDIDREGLLRLAEDLSRLWNDSLADMRLKKRIVRTLIEGSWLMWITQALTLSDGHIARVLNRLGLKTGRGNSWIAPRVNSLRNHQGIPVYDPARREKEGWLTLDEAAAELRVSASARTTRDPPRTPGRAACAVVDSSGGSGA
jgi:hypothetical protein